MVVHEYVTQPLEKVEYRSLIRRAMELAEYQRFDAAVAYATNRGVAALDSIFTGPQRDSWERMTKRFLVGIDWCRSDPPALTSLADMPKSTVRIPSGEVTVRLKGCTPSLPFHPKAFILSGPDAVAIVSGSGNLSRNGMMRGHEFGSLVVASTPLSKSEGNDLFDAQNVVRWFQQLWREATPLREILARYQRQCDSVENLRSPAPTDDDTEETDVTGASASRHRALSPRQLRQLRAARRLWIEAMITENYRGKKPGNQLMMSPMTRVFFGFRAIDVPKKTTIGDVSIRFEDTVSDNCALRYAHDGMDVLNLPIPGSGGPPKYAGETLLFERRPDETYRLSLGGAKDKVAWRKKSEKIDAIIKMKSGREFGVF